MGMKLLPPRRPNKPKTPLQVVIQNILCVLRDSTLHGRKFKRGRRHHPALPTSIIFNDHDTVASSVSTPVMPNSIEVAKVTKSLAKFQLASSPSLHNNNSSHGNNTIGSNPNGKSCCYNNNSIGKSSHNHVIGTSQKNLLPYAAKVHDFPWSDGIQKGWYSGPIDENFQPHGLGAFLSAVNGSKTSGTWFHGFLIKLSEAVVEEDEDEDDEIDEDYYDNDDDDDKNARSNSKSINQNNGFSTDNGPMCLAHTFHPQYSLGDIALHPQDMIIKHSKEKSHKSVSKLKKFDHAFIKRSNGEWTCAILADRALQPVNTNNSSSRAMEKCYNGMNNATANDNHHHHHQQSSTKWYHLHGIKEGMEVEECMLFIINGYGETKVIRKKHWGKYVRRFNTKNFNCGSSSRD